MNALQNIINKNTLLWFPLLIASFSVIFEPSPYIILFSCAISFIYWVWKLFSWPDSIRKSPPLRKRSYIWLFMVYYSCVTYLFSLAYYAAVKLGSKIVKGGEPIESLMDCFYFSIATATTLGYGDLIPNHIFTKCLSILEVSFGTIFIITILTVVLTFSNSYTSGGVTSNELDE